ncbi:hypothetical protein [Tychonema sp. LEGE 07196]|uniref:hypothetical protein n=1 Tax=Tychonema sp. LEGE 07196 TaxID=1828665 RepID=UPI00187E2A3C|nr:hypothetical protein [Tychonema sp. LEGE 07196]
MRSLVELLSRFFPTDRLTDPQPTAATANSSDSQQQRQPSGVRQVKMLVDV